MTDIFHANRQAMQRAGQTAGTVVFASEVLRELPEDHANFGLLGEIEADAHATVYVDYVTGTVRRSSPNGETLTFLHNSQGSAPSPQFEPGPTS